MSGYLLILVWVAFVGFVVWSSRILSGRDEVAVWNRGGGISVPGVILAVLPLVIWTGFRGNVGDTAGYRGAFALMPSSLSGISDYIINVVTKDRGFYFSSALIKTVIGNRVQLYFIILAAAQAFFVFRFFRKYSSSFVLCYFLFIASTDYISWMFNGIRQFTAVTITLAGFYFAVNKKFIRAIIIILIAALFHMSALILIPFIFLCQGRAWNWKTILWIIAVIAVIVYVDRFTEILDTLLTDTQFENVVSDWKSWDDDGTSPIRALVYSIPALISLLGRRYIRDERDPVLNYCSNMSVISAGLYWISVFTSGIFIGRLPIYASLYAYPAMIRTIDLMFTKFSARVVYFAMIALYLAYYAYAIRYQYGLI
ncbi:MAG: EpsG family protein [Lachnospiraceae bacterium]|nr:EpsG family protein [Lachnospiraceae bacterium]